MTSESSAVPAGPDRRSYAALRIPSARTYLMFAAMAMMADHTEHVISYWMIYAQFRSPSLAGFAIVAHWVPFLLGSVWAGALADRYDPRRIIQVSMALFMLVSLAWGVLFFTDSLEKWHAVVLLIVHGCAGALWAPAGQMLIHAVVGEKTLQSAIRMMATAMMMGTLLGPAVGGLLLISLGPSLGIMINAVVYLPMIAWLISNPSDMQREAANRPGAMRGYGDLLRAVKQISAIPVVFSMTVLAGVAAAFVGNGHHPQMPGFARDFGFEFDGIRYTLLLCANAAGALTAGIVLESRALLPACQRTAFILAGLWSIAICGFAISTSYVLAIGLLLCAGFFELSFNSMTRTLAHLHAPPELRGRAIGLFNVGALGGRTFSGVTIGFGGGIVGIHWSLGLSAAALLVAILVLFVWATRAGAFNPAPAR